MTDRYRITLVQSRIKNKPYAKVDGTYSGPTWVNDIGLQDIDLDIDATFTILEKLQKHPLMCMVYGTAVKERIVKTDRTMKNFTEEPIHLITFDLDDYRTPNYQKLGVDVTYNQIVADADYFIERNLPPEFQNTSYILRFSSSFMVREDGVLRAHIVFLSEKPQYPREIGLWMKQIELQSDPTFYLNLTQPVFTAAPVCYDEIDPLAIRQDYFPRISLIRKEQDLIPGEWLPLSGRRKAKPETISRLPSVNTLTGKVGSFCRQVSPEEVLNYLGYSSKGENRFLAPTSKTGLPGAVVFKNGYMFSHHNEDPIDQVINKIYGYRRLSLNAHDLMYGWARLQLKTNPKVMGDYEFMLDQALSEDQSYQDEIQEELLARCDWLIEDGFSGLNKQIVTGVVQDAMDLGLNQMSRDTIAGVIATKTKIRKTDINNEFKNIRRERAYDQDRYDPDANLRHMADIFRRQGILFAHHGVMTGDYWCYYKDLRMWRRRNHTQTEAFIYDHVHEGIPGKMEIDFSKTEKLFRLIMRQACENPMVFKGGAGWAFKDGVYGILMEDLFRDTKWNPDKAVRTLQKDDHIYKMLPITFEDWKKWKDRKPEMFLRFLETTCEEDYDVMDLIQEFGGYVLGDSYYLHKFLIIEGLPGSGKSILGKVLQECVGPQFYTATSLSSIGSRFGLGSMGGIKLALMSEARAVDFGAIRAAIPILLKITGNDAIDTEAKGKSYITETLDVKLIVLTNRIPVLPDDTGALAQRILMVKFNKIFRGTKHEILGLDRMLVEQELPGIIRFFLRGLAKLSERKQFTEPKEGPSRVMKESVLQQIDPLRTFLDDFFIVNPHGDREAFITQSDFLKYFRAYCYRLTQNTDKKIIAKRASIRFIQSLVPQVERRRLKRKDDKPGAQPWLYVGLIPNTELAMEFAQEILELNTTEVD